MKSVRKSINNHVLITKKMLGRLKDVQVFRGLAAGVSAHFFVEAKV